MILEDERLPLIDRLVAHQSVVLSVCAEAFRF